MRFATDAAHATLALPPHPRIRRCPPRGAICCGRPPPCSAPSNAASARCAHAARGDDGGFRRHRQRRRLGLEGRLRGVRGRAASLPAPPLPGHARPRRIERAGCSPCSASSPRSRRRTRGAPRKASSSSNSRRRIELGFIAALAAGLTPADLVLEPSAGTGPARHLRRAARRARSRSTRSPGTRADLLALLFPGAPVTRFNAEQIHDYLPDEVRPTVDPHEPALLGRASCQGRLGGHGFAPSALGAAPPCPRRPPGGDHGRECFSPSSRRTARPSRSWQTSAASSSAPGISGALYRRHGTTIETRLTVIDRVPAPGGAGDVPCHPMAESAGGAARSRHRPCPRAACRRARRLPHSDPRPALLFPLPARTSAPARRRRRSRRPSRPRPSRRSSSPIYMSTRPAPPADARSPATRSMSPTASRPSASRARSPIPPGSSSRRRWPPSSRPGPPTGRIFPARVVTEGLLSDAQLESVIYAGEAHTRHLAGRWKVNESLDVHRRRPRRRRRRPSASAAAGFWATAPAPARDARWPASCSTTG